MTTGALLRAAALAAVIAGTAVAPAQGAAPAEPTVGIIVAREPGLSVQDRRRLRAAADAEFDRVVPLLPRTAVLQVPRERLHEALAGLNADPGVRYAELDAPIRIAAEPLEDQQWGLQRIQAHEAAALPVTGAGATVAVVDTGVDFSHTELDGRIATNPAETVNGVDDDGNGFVDDDRGWDFVDRDRTPQDANGHGTLVSGVVAAERNGQGIAGVAPGARVLPVRALDASGSGDTSQVASALAYAGDLGVPVVTASLGGVSGGQTLDAAMRQYPGSLYVVAAGNEGADNDASLSYPCNSTAVNVVCVGATDRSDLRASFSNVGRRTVDLFAPGVDILSTDLGGAYDTADGTSFSTPFVSGTAALVLNARPGAGTVPLKNALLAGADPVPGLASLSVTGARLNARGALNAQPADRDGDGIGDVWDLCPGAADPQQADTDGDGIGDACDDFDGDGIVDPQDKCPQEPAPKSADGCAATIDTDGDGRFDRSDACPTVAGPGTVDGCPAPPPRGDRDGDGVVDAEDRCPRTASRRESGCPRPAVEGLSVQVLRCATPRPCRRVRVRVRLDRPARVRVEAEQRRCRRKACRWERVDVARRTLRRRSGSVTLAARRRGRVRLVAVALLGPERSAARRRTVRVR